MFDSPGSTEANLTQEAAALYRFREGEVLDPERINANLLALARELEEERGLRYTRSMVCFPLTGIADTDAAVLRQVPLRNPSALNVQIEKVELVITLDADATVTLTPSSGLGDIPSLSLDCTADTEARGVIAKAADLPSGTGDHIQLGIDSAANVDDGHIVLHFRSDRGSQGDDFEPYIPTLYQADTSRAGSHLDTELQALAAAAAEHSAAIKDVTVNAYVLRAPTAGTYVLPSFKPDRFIAETQLWVVAGSGTHSANTRDPSGTDDITASATASSATAWAHDRQTGDSRDTQSGSNPVGDTEVVVDTGGAALVVVYEFDRGYTTT